MKAGSVSSSAIANATAIYTARAEAEEIARLMTALDWAQADSHELLLCAAEAGHAKLGEALKRARAAHEASNARAA